MGINRRSYLKTLGVIGGSLTAGKVLGNPVRKSAEETEFYGMLYDSTRCIGCQSCELACAQHYGMPEPDDYPEVGVVRETD